MTQCWEYYQKFFDDSIYKNLIGNLENFCEQTKIRIYGHLLESRRISCIFSDVDKKNRIIPNDNGGYYDVPIYAWDEAPEQINSIRYVLEGQFNKQLDYVLCHIYRDHNDYIGWHRDRESLNTDVFSVSLGSSRRFQFRRADKKKGFDEEYLLEDGDLIHMFGGEENKGCQHLYKHRVPVMIGRDYKNILRENNIEIAGRKTNKELIEIMKKHGLVPKRINLTFRQLE